MPNLGKKERNGPNLNLMAKEMQHIIFRVTISPEIIILQRKKRALRYIYPHILYVGLRLGLGLSGGVRVGVRIRK